MDRTSNSSDPKNDKGFVKRFVQSFFQSNDDQKKSTMAERGESHDRKEQETQREEETEESDESTESSKSTTSAESSKSTTSTSKSTTSTESSTYASKVASKASKPSTATTSKGSASTKSSSTAYASKVRQASKPSTATTTTTTAKGTYASKVTSKSSKLAGDIFLVAIPEIMVYSFNFYLFTWVLEGVDMGGSVVIHLAAAVFGLGVSYTLFSGDEGSAKDNISNYTSDPFSIIGTLILWIYWPSFNGALAGDNQGRVAINTIFLLTGSAIAAFCASRTFRHSGKFEMVDIANATLAGGVAVGSSADLIIGPGAAMLIGCSAGFISTLGFIHLTPWLEAKFGLTDTCGVLNLHGTPGIIGSVAGVILSAAAAADKSVYGQEFNSIFPRGDNQWGYQLAGLFATIGFMGISGMIVGAAVKKLTNGAARPKDQLFCDHGEFEINTAEYDLIRQMEDGEGLSKGQIAEQ